jgi:NitT/TauT family transport system substrate-binding protein
MHLDTGKEPRGLRQHGVNRFSVAAKSLAVAAAGFAVFAMTSSPASAAAVKDYGKPGEAINLVIGYQPYYTESWSGVVMRDKKFYEKYLPKGSKVEFQIGLQGAIIVNGMLAGKVDVGYVGDMPAIVSTSHAEVRDVRMVAAVGLGQDQCNNFLVRTDAPKFKSPEEAIKWMDGKHVAVPKGACSDRFARAVFKRFNIKPASRLVHDKLARKVATGASVNENDGAFLVMPEALIKQRPDVVKGWLEAELDAELYFADSKHAMEVAKMAASQTTGFPEKALWASAYGQTPKSEGGTDIRITLPYTFTPQVMDLVHKASTFLLEIKSIKAEIRPEAVMSNLTEDILKARNLKAPVGEVKALPDSAYTGK